MSATVAAWGGASLTVTVSGTDVSCDVVACTVDRSRNRLWDPPDAGTAQIVLNLEEGGQPSTRGPVGAIVTVKVAFGAVNRFLFTGTVQLRRRIAIPQADTIVLDCVDGFETLSRINRRPAITDVAVGDGEAVNQRISRWLDEGGWAAPTDLDSSDFTCPGTLIDGNVLVKIQEAAFADGGDFYIEGDGTARFMSWNWRALDDTAVAVFSDRRLHEWVPYSSANLHDDLDEVQNKVTGTRRPVDDTDEPEAQTATNTSSVTTYGERGDALDDLELETDGQVATRVAAVVEIAGGPNARFDSVVVQPAFDPARSWPRTIPVTVGSLIGCNRVWADGAETALYAHVIGEVWTFSPTDATVEYRCSGTGTWDTIRPPRPPLALERCEDGSIRIPPGYPCDTESTIYIKDVDGEIVATYPPGSLCDCGTVFVPDDGVELCLDNGTDTETCVPIDDPRLAAVLWFDVLEPGPNLIERVDGDAVAGGPGFEDTELDAIPGDFDAINANDTGGLIGAEHSSHVEAQALTGGWRLDFWLYLAAADIGADITIINLDSVRVGITTVGPPARPWLTVTVIDEDEATNLSGPLDELDFLAWQHIVISWNPDDVGFELSVSLS